MPALQNPKHEAFAVRCANGASGTQAYRECVAGKNTKTNTCMSQASVMLSDPKIALRVKELRRSFREVLDEKFGIRAENIVGYLVEIMETPVGELDANHRMTAEIRDTKEDQTIKGLNKLDAVDKLCKLAGFYESEKTSVEVPGLAELLDRLRKPGIPRVPERSE